MESSSENISPKQSRKDFWKEIIKLVVLAVIIVIPFRLYIAKPFLVEGASMDPTFDTGDYLIVDELSYQFKAPERGSILVCKYPLDPRKHFIKRVIGLPGETIEVREGVITILRRRAILRLGRQPHVERRLESLGASAGGKHYWPTDPPRLASRNFPRTS
mgnify:CR=1 FL=1